MTTCSSLTSTSIVPSSCSRFQLRGKNLFLTYPQCPLPKENAVIALKARFPTELDWYIIASENHKDGTPHLHCLLGFKEAFVSRKVDAFDFIADKHGNYQVARNVRNSVKYVTKDNNYLCEGIDVKKIINKEEGKKWEGIAKLCQEGKTLSEINDLDPGFVLQNKRKLEEYLTWTNKRKDKLSLLEWVPISGGDIQDMDTDAERQIAIWLNENIRQQRIFKQKQLYIWGPPNMGKSTLIKYLSKYLNIYHIPRDEDFYDDYEDQVYDLAVLDEFTHTKTMQWLNQFLDGQSFYLRKKGGQVLKKENLPVIILSNFELSSNYRKLYEASKLGPLMERLLFVEVKSFISIFQ